MRTLDSQSRLQMNFSSRKHTYYCKRNKETMQYDFKRDNLKSPRWRHLTVWIITQTPHTTPSDCEEVCNPWSSTDPVHWNPVNYDHCHFGHSEHACEVYVMWCWHLCKWGTSRNHDCWGNVKSKHYSFFLLFKWFIKCSHYGHDMR